MEFYLICAILLISLISLTLTFFLAVYVVRSMDKTTMMIRDLSSILSEPLATEMLTNSNSESAIKTWDQKYEEELEMIQRRLRQASGLADLPISSSYNAPPAPNSQAAEGLKIVDR